MNHWLARLLGVVLAVAGAASTLGCTSGGSPGGPSTEATGTTSLRLASWQWQDLDDRKHFPAINYVVRQNGAAIAQGSTNTTENDQVEVVIANIPTGPKTTVTLSATSVDGAWICSGTSRPVTEKCTDNDEDDEVRVGLACVNKFVRSWRRVPVSAEANLVCRSDAGVDACVRKTQAQACGMNNCGSATDGCGGTIVCGTCTGSGQVCSGAGGAAGTCGCTPKTTTAACGTNNCGAAPDGCGGTVTCGTCSAPNTCSTSTGSGMCSCTPLTVAQACGTNACGNATDGCGGSVSCGTCAVGSPCSSSTGPGSCGCTPITTTAACGTNNCGVAPDGCGGTVSCGTCAAPQSCSASSGAGTCGCVPQPVAQACRLSSNPPGAIPCGTAPDGCGGTYACGVCQAPNVCPTTTGPSSCACVPQPLARICGSSNCGIAADGCGGTVSCGTCSGTGQVCVVGDGSTLGQCGCSPKTAAQVCGASNCGSAPDGCGGTVSCGSCASGVLCSGVGGAPGTCGCSPQTAAQACGGSTCGSAPDGCTGTLSCGTCTAPQSCVPSGGVSTCQCIPKTASQACAGAICGVASDGCGGSVSCGTCGPGLSCSSSGQCAGAGCPAKCPLGDNCGTFIPPQAGCPPLNCGTCGPPNTCGGGGIANQCGVSGTLGCETFNNGGACTPTEQLFVDKSIDCYTCLVDSGCLDDAAFGDTGHECGDVGGVAAKGAAAGTARSALCLSTLACALDTGCASPDVALCYCGSLGAGDLCTTSGSPSAANGACAATELAALEHSSTDAPVQVVPDFFNIVTGGGMANGILNCARIASCTSCLAPGGGCTPLTAAAACGTGNCGTVPDGCGGTISCGACTAPQTCSVANGVGVCQCVPKTPAQACGMATCGAAPDGCGGTVACGTCLAGQPCSGAGGSLGTCGCNPQTMQQACGTNNCGSAPDGCAGAVPCGTCSAQTVCSVTTGAGVCQCIPKTPAQACGASNCGSAPDGCGGTIACGTCTSPSACSSLTGPGRCGCTPQTAMQGCGTDNCGFVPDGCGGTFSCGTCTAPETCGGGGVDNQCGSSTTSPCAGFNNSGVCTPTEQLFANKSVACYTCLANSGCLDDDAFGDVGHECGDVSGNAAKGSAAGTPRSSLCLSAVSCVLATTCASQDIANCYCGSLGPGDGCTTSADPTAANGACAAIELAAIEHGTTELPSAVVTDFFNTNTGGGMANQIFHCAAIGLCPMCLQ